MKRHPKFSQPQEHQLDSGHQHVASQGAQEFAGADEILRFDAAQTIVPPEVAQRLQKSLGADSSKSSWWQKLFGR